jgi:hypothetical protein
MKQEKQTCIEDSLVSINVSWLLITISINVSWLLIIISINVSWLLITNNKEELQILTFLFYVPFHYASRSWTSYIMVTITKSWTILHNVDLLKSMTWYIDTILFRLLMWVFNPLVYVCKIAYQYILTTNWYNPLFSFPKL